MEDITESTIAYFISEQKLADRISLSSSLLSTKKENWISTFERDIFSLFKLNFKNSIFREINYELDKCAVREIQYLSFLSDLYPKELIRLPDFPCILFYKGNLKTLINNKRISIVGSRKADFNGKEIAFNVANILANLSVVIVSGLAYGIDATSHRGAISNRKKASTIAVLGNGLNTIYPSLNQKLSEEIIENHGLILSQFKPTMKPLPHNFLNRNRVIAGLSELTLVVQAEEKSGSLVTAKYANEYGKIIAAVPGDTKNKLHQGCNKIIKSGAYLIENEKDIIELLNIDCQINEMPKKEDNEILILLKKYGKMNIEQIDNLTKKGIDISKELLILEIKKKITKLPGNYYSLNLR